VEQCGIKRPEHHGGEALAGLEEGLGSHWPLKVCGPPVVDGQSVEFLLDAATHAVEHERQ
jgi:hypothetical protein